MILSYQKGEKAILEKDYDNVIINMRNFLERAEGNNPKLKEKLKFAYLFLLSGYKKTGRIDECKQISDKMLILFPEDKDKIQKIISNPN